MPENINLPGVAASDFNLARERYYAGLRAGYTPEQAEEMYLEPMRLKWKTLIAASPRTTQSISGSFEPVAAEDVAQMDKALSNFYQGVKAGYDPKDAVAQYISPVASGVIAAGWARQEQDRANMSDALKEAAQSKAEQARNEDIGASMAADILRQTGDYNAAASIPPSMGFPLTPEVKMSLSKEAAKEQESKLHPDPIKALSRAGSIALQGKRLLESPLFNESTPAGTNALTGRAQDLISSAMRSVPGGSSILNPTGTGVLTNAVPKFRVIGIRQVQ